MSEIKKIKVAGSEYGIADEVNRIELQNLKNGVNASISWQGQDLNDCTTEGTYLLKGTRTSGDNVPIINEGTITARLSVLVTENSGNKVVTQVLTLNNNTGGEGNVYIRSQQAGAWKPWGKLQTNVEVGQVNTLDNLTDNGIYSGVLTNGTPTAMGTFYDTFVLIVINNYSVASGTGTPHCISQLQYSLALGGGISINKRTSIGGTWSEWSEIGDKYELPVATATTLGGIKLGTEFEHDQGGLHINLGSGLMRYFDEGILTTKITLAPAAGHNIGGVIIGSGIGVNGEGKISVALGANSGLRYNGNDITLSLGTNSPWEPSSITNGILPLVTGVPYNSFFKDGKVGVPLAKDSALELTNYGVSVKRETEVKSDSTNPVESQAIAAAIEAAETNAIEQGKRAALINMYSLIGAFYDKNTDTFEFNTVTNLSWGEMGATYAYRDIVYRLHFPRVGQVISNLRVIAPLPNILTSPSIKIEGLNTFYGTGIELFALCKLTSTNYDTYLNAVRPDISPVCTYMYDTFRLCSKLKAVFPINLKNCQTLKKETFAGCVALEELRLLNLPLSLNLDDCPLISKASILYIITAAAPASAITITLHADAYARLADDADIIAALEAQPLVTLVSA